MAQVEVSVEELEAVRIELIKRVNESLTLNEKQFLLSFKNKQSQWELLGVPNASELPSVKWKLQNLAKLEAGKHKVLHEKLKAIL